GLREPHQDPGGCVGRRAWSVAAGGGPGVAPPGGHLCLAARLVERTGDGDRVRLPVVLPGVLVRPCVLNADRLADELRDHGRVEGDVVSLVLAVATGALDVDAV